MLRSLNRNWTCCCSSQETSITIQADWKARDILLRSLLKSLPNTRVSFCSPAAGALFARNSKKATPKSAKLSYPQFLYLLKHLFPSRSFKPTPAGRKVFEFYPLEILGPDGLGVLAPLRENEDK